MEDHPKQLPSNSCAANNLEGNEKAVNVEILKHLKTAGIINDSQYGFRHQRSTGDLLAYVTYIWKPIYFT